MKPILFLLLASLAVAGCSETDYDKLPEAVVTATTNNKSNSAGNNSNDNISSDSSSNNSKRRHKTRSATSHYCNYPTRKGRPCKRIVQGASGYCWQHTH